MNLASAVGPRAPARRHRDTWRAWIPGVSLLAAVVAVHALGLVKSEHLIDGLLVIAGKKLPNGRARDGKRWRLAEDTRTGEREGVPLNA